MTTKEITTTIIWIITLVLMLAAPYIIIYIGPAMNRWIDKHPIITETILIIILLVVLFGCINSFSNGKLLEKIL
jgi:hypothetical protein